MELLGHMGNPGYSEFMSGGNDRSSIETRNKDSSEVVVGGVEDPAVAASAVEGLNHPDLPLPQLCCGRGFCRKTQ
jgi:hypothetical protein